MTPLLSRVSPVGVSMKDAPTNVPPPYGMQVGQHLGTQPEGSGIAGCWACWQSTPWIPARMSSTGEFSWCCVIYCFCSNDCSMSDYKCLLAGGPDSENSHDLLPESMEPQSGLMSQFRHQPPFQGGWGLGRLEEQTQGRERAVQKGIQGLGLPRVSAKS